VSEKLKSEKFKAAGQKPTPVSHCGIQASMLILGYHVEWPIAFIVPSSRIRGAWLRSSSEPRYLEALKKVPRSG